MGKSLIVEKIFPSSIAKKTTPQRTEDFSWSETKQTRIKIIAPIERTIFSIASDFEVTSSLANKREPQRQKIPKNDTNITKNNGQ